MPTIRFFIRALICAACISLLLALATGLWLLKLTWVGITAPVWVVYLSALVFFTGGMLWAVFNPFGRHKNHN